VSLSHFFESNGWEETGSITLPARTAKFVEPSFLPLAEPTLALLARRYSSGIYRHQAEALNAALENHNICIATGTSSGKSLGVIVKCCGLVG
jgi:DEAD/DEAH box helicase domain-containing protein